MTSTISSKNKYFGKLFRWAFSRNKGIMTVLSVIMVIVNVIDLFLIVQNINTRNNSVESELLSKTISNNIGYTSIIFSQTIAVLFSIISSSHTFSFLHNKRSTDMFGAIPSTRSTLYFSHLSGGMLSIIIPFIVGSLGITAFMTRSPEYLMYNLAAIFFGIIGIAAVYSFSALIAYCCGTTRDTNIIILSSNAIYIGVVITFSEIIIGMIPGLSSSYLFNTPITTLLTPISFCHYMDGYLIGKQSTALWTTIIWSIIYITAVIILGNTAAKTRRAETAQSEFNIKWVPLVIKLGMSVLIGGFAGLIGAMTFRNRDNYNNMHSFVFWYILIGFAALFILHLIFSKGLKGNFLPTLISYVITTAGVFLLMIALSYGLGIDTYIPDVSNIESVQFAGQVYYEPENIETVTNIHKTMIEGIQKEYPLPYYIGCYNKSRSSDYSESNSMVKSVSFDFHYNKKIGFSTDREYCSMYYYHSKNFNIAKMEELLKKLYNSAEYKKQTNPLLWKNDGAENNEKQLYSAYMEFYIYNPNFEEEYYNSDNKYQFYDSQEIGENQELINGLISALKTDILADDKYYVKASINQKSNDSSPFLGESYLYLELNNKSDSSSQSYDYYYFNGKTNAFFITKDYTNTWNYLNNYGLATNKWSALKNYDI